MKVERVVVCIDFSPSSVDAASWVARFFAPGAELVLVHVIAIPKAPPIVRNRFARRDLLVGTVREGADKRLREISLSLSADRVWLEVREGEPVECITTLADAFSAELVVAGAHGERAGPFEGLGSTADHLVRASTRPVLLVTNPRLTTPRNVLVPLDKPEHASGALSWVSALSHRLGARVTAMHVMTGGVSSGALAALAVVSGTSPSDVSTPPAVGEGSDRWLEGAIAAGVPREQASSEVVFGDPTHEILAAARRLDTDLIVMPRRAKGNLRRAVLGSVVEGVLRGASCPVLVVPESSAQRR
jgi:nucleotide-binding universal stress UspA family protein